MLEKTIPLNKDHAVKEVIFSLQLTKTPNTTSIKKLLGLKEVLKNDFPEFNVLNQMTLQFSPNQFEMNTPTNIPNGEVSGIFLRHINDAGTIDWTARTGQNIIIINCLDYQGWEKSWPKARLYLETLTEQLIENNSIQAINLQYTNIFISQLASIEKYNLNHVFKSNTTYLTDNVKSSGPYWHLFQGWLEDSAIINNKCLNNLNLGTSMANDEHVTSVTLLRQAQLKSQGLENLDAIMNQLHMDIKKILTDLLAPDMAARIGLKDS